MITMETSLQCSIADKQQFRHPFDDVPEEAGMVRMPEVAFVLSVSPEVWNSVFSECELLSGQTSKQATASSP